MLGSYELPVGLFTHLNLFKRITAGNQIPNLSSCVFSSVIEQRNGDHYRQSVGQTAAVDEIKAGLFGVVVAINLAVPRIC